MDITRWPWCCGLPQDHDEQNIIENGDSMWRDALLQDHDEQNVIEDGDSMWRDAYLAA